MKPFDGKRKSKFSYAAIVLASLLLIIFVCQMDGLSIGAQTEQELAAKYSPILRFTNNEKFYPTTVNYFISKSSLIDHYSGVVVSSSPAPETLGSHTSPNLYLNHNSETLEAIAADYSMDVASNGYTIYARISGVGDPTIIQYWLFYAFNKGPLNDHQGDFEVIELFLDGAGNPKTVLYSQHFTGQNAAWNEVEKVDTHPIAYVAEGSHANYFRSYQGKMGLESDIVGSDGITITFDDSNIVMLHNQSWLNFPGRWGYWGTEDEVALGKAGPHGPVFNQGGIRWTQPVNYLNQTFTVNSTYFIFAWIVANFLLLLFIYILIRAGWKIFNIYRLKRKGGLLVTKFLKSRGGLFLIIGIVSMLMAFVALFLPWYVISASSDSGPLAQEEAVNLLMLDGVNGLSVNLFLGSGESTSGFRNVFSTQLPFAIIFIAGLILLTLDIVVLKSGKKLGTKFIIGAIVSVIPFILIFVFISQLPSFLPWASMLMPSTTLPLQLETMVNSIAANPMAGTVTQSFEVVGTTTVNWGFGIGAYLFLVAAILRIVSGIFLLTTPELTSQTQIP